MSEPILRSMADAAPSYGSLNNNTTTTTTAITITENPLASPSHSPPSSSPRRVRFWEPPVSQQPPPFQSSPSSYSSPSTSAIMGAGRVPVRYNSNNSLSPRMHVNTSVATKLGISQQEAERHPLLARPADDADAHRMSMLRHRMKYFRALAKEDEVFDATEIPSHVLPPVLGVFDLQDGTKIKKQSSIQTIFCVWNTMLGSTLLTMPWGFAHSGIIPGVLLAIFLCAVSLYTCVIVVRRGNAENTMDFSALCLSYLGPWAHRLYQGASICVLVGALIAYHNYITSALGSLMSIQKKQPLWIAGVTSASILLLLSLKKDPRFLVRLNSFGVLSVLFTMFFMIYEGSPAGDGREVMHSGEVHTIKLMPDDFSIKSIAPLSGILGMSFFIHNAILPIMANNPHPEHNIRDLTIAFALCLLCYLAVGLVPNFFIKGSALMENQNFLAPFGATNGMACAARVALTLQLTLVYPLILYLLRVEVFGAVLGRKDTYPGLPTSVVMNSGIVAVTTLMAIKVPGVGDVLRWSGATMGFVVLYLLPPLVELSARSLSSKKSLYTPIETDMPETVDRTKKRVQARQEAQHSNVALFALVVVFVVGVGLTVIALQVLQTV